MYYNTCQKEKEFQQLSQDTVIMIKIFMSLKRVKPSLWAIHGHNRKIKGDV